MTKILPILKARANLCGRIGNIGKNNTNLIK